MGTYATVQLDFKRADRKPLKAATVKGKGNETEQLPLYTNKDSVVGEVRHVLFQCKHPSGKSASWDASNDFCRFVLPTLLAKR